MDQHQMPDFIQQCAAWPAFGAAPDYSIFNVPPPPTTPFSNAPSFNADSSPRSPTFPNGCAVPASQPSSCNPYNGYGTMPSFDYSWYYMQQPETYGQIAPVDVDVKNFSMFNQWRTSALLDANRTPRLDTQRQRSGGPIFEHKTGRGTNNVRVRTADKYRTVYSDQIRLQLEAEFHNNEFISAERKADLAVELNLTERQIKIWFQNRRAKSRKDKSRRHSNTINTMNLNLTA